MNCGFCTRFTFWHNIQFRVFNLRYNIKSIECVDVLPLVVVVAASARYLYIFFFNFRVRYNPFQMHDGNMYSINSFLISLDIANCNRFNSIVVCSETGLYLTIRIDSKLYIYRSLDCYLLLFLFDSENLFDNYYFVAFEI